MLLSGHDILPQNSLDPSIRWVSRAATALPLLSDISETSTSEIRSATIIAFTLLRPDAMVELHPAACTSMPEPLAYRVAAV